MIYILRSDVHPARLLIGTADWIHEERRRLASGPLVPAWPDFEGHLQEHAFQGVHSVRDGRLSWMRNLECAGTLEGDEAEAAALRDELWPATRHQGSYLPPIYLSPADLLRWRDDDPGSTPWRIAPPEFLERIAAETLPWDVSAAETLGIKGPGRAKRRPKG